MSAATLLRTLEELAMLHNLVCVWTNCRIKLEEELGREDAV